MLNVLLNFVERRIITAEILWTVVGKIALYVCGTNATVSSQRTVISFKLRKTIQ